MTMGITRTLSLARQQG